MSAKENTEFQSQNGIHIIGAECGPEYLSDPVLNGWSGDVFAASLRKHFYSLTDLTVKITFSPDISFIFICSFSSCFPTHILLDNTRHAACTYRQWQAVLPLIFRYFSNHECWNGPAILMYQIQSNFSCIYHTTPFFFQHTSLCLCVIMHLCMCLCALFIYCLFMDKFHFIFPRLLHYWRVDCGNLKQPSSFLFFSKCACLS